MARLPWLFCFVCLGCQSLDPSLPLVRNEPSADARSRDPEADAALARAAEALQAGNQEAACDQLRRYVEAHPEAIPARVLHAEVLFRLARTVEARAAYEYAIAALQQHESDADSLIHCHGRLLDLAGDD